MTNDFRRSQAKRLEEEFYKLKDKQIISRIRVAYLEAKGTDTSMSEAMELELLKSEIPQWREQIKKIGTELRSFQVPYRVRYSVVYSNTDEPEWKTDEFWLSSDVKIVDGLPDYNDKGAVELMRELVRKIQVRYEVEEISEIRRVS